MDFSKLLVGIGPVELFGYAAVAVNIAAPSPLNFADRPIT
jgi:hypothetical protein